MFWSTRMDHCRKSWGTLFEATKSSTPLLGKGTKASRSAAALASIGTVSPGNGFPVVGSIGAIHPWDIIVGFALGEFGLHSLKSPVRIRAEGVKFSSTEPCRYRANCCEKKKYVFPL